MTPKPALTNASQLSEVTYVSILASYDPYNIILFFAQNQKKVGFDLKLGTCASALTWCSERAILSEFSENSGNF